MLKALELVGFKSFADRTRFEFPPGITVVVGPNGSGKSNVVDAIKWVLGEQSVKSLRGREMADVIFNGSGGRRAVNSAEITLTLDNSKHLLAIDTPEVHITRRVYRSGEGEYLINRNPARLRDIRDLLAGTGMGTQAYSVIEQGKVDLLLQSSPKDRRLIFEEAAGISRFKLRKIEALRRLERVDQNLLRLADIVDEVDNRLRGVRTQAGKARRYKEYTDRLQELRTQVGLVDWRRLSQRLAEVEAQWRSSVDLRDSAAAESERLEAELLQLDTAADEINEQIRQSELHSAANRERIAAAESTIEHERNRVVDLEQELARYRRQLAVMSTRAGDLQQQLRDTSESLRTAEENHRDTARRLVEAERGLTDVIALLDRLRSESQQRRTDYLQQMRQVAALGNETSSLESQAGAAADVKQHARDRIIEIDQSLTALQSELNDLLRVRDDLTAKVQQRARLAEDAKQLLAEHQQRHAAGQDELAELRRRHSAAAERAAVLDELVRRYEGLSAGVKEVLTRAADRTDPIFRAVHGLAADLFQAGVEAAPLVDIALGDVAHHVVASRSPALMEFLRGHSGRLAGRVGFLWLDGNKLDWSDDSESDAPMLANQQPRDSDRRLGPDLEGLPGVLGRGDRFVQHDARFLPLARRLLGRTWFVEKLAHALELSATVGRGLTFVTLAGELLEADGTLTVGPRGQTSGLLAQRSQLRALQTQLVELQSAIESLQSSLAGISEQIVAQQQLGDRRTAEYNQAAEALAENRLALTAGEERRAQLQRQRNSLEAELLAAENRHEEILRRLAETREKHRLLECGLSRTEAELTRVDQQIDRLEGRRLAASRDTTEIKVELAKCEERLRNLQARMRQFEENRQERHRAIDETRERLDECQQRGELARRNILTAEAELAELYLRKEVYSAQTAALLTRRGELQQQRAALTAEIQKVHGRVRKLEEKVHADELAANEVRHERNTLADRMRDDYGIEISAVEQSAGTEQSQDREEVQQEIDQLRQKISSLGNVNLEALAELEELESRYALLSGQYQDLMSAKASLMKIIERIDGDSRRLFSDTLDTVKGHFQELFRDLFGGGQADIVLEDNADILESGIEIVARPPGKEPRSISLLSGGEKTLTCVALLLAIFRSRPSPFCVLDEVDAALDEANIDRFTQVLRSFLTWTQFIIVTHSKKTMTAANTIYGVTMQESGISKQVSVRFEDVSDDGRILSTPAAEEAA